MTQATTEISAPVGLSAEQAEFFRVNGYIVLPQAVSPEAVARARHAIHHEMGKGIPPEELRTWNSQSFFPSIAPSESITDLFNASVLRPTLESLLGEGKVTYSGRGQIALRFPREPGATPRPPGGHVDGMHSPDNGVPKGTLSSFTALVGVFLSDVSRPDAGNFCVWPGTHRLHSEYFQEHGAKCLLEDNKLPPIEKPAAVQIEAKAGDAVIAHYLLAHGAAGNVSPDPRYAIFFRIQVPEHKEQRVEVLTDIWREWPGLRD
jgi:hypothetical protein